MGYISAQLSSYEISVITGDVSGAGTDANVYILLFGEKGETGRIFCTYEILNQITKVQSDWKHRKYD